MYVRIMYFVILRSHDGRWIVTGGTAGVIRLWEVIAQSGSPTLHFVAQSKAENSHSKPITAIAFSLDDKQVISTG